ncbi:MAG: hypothetical protein M9921_11670 [Fimbriimonadaceae bacterium]|nr:hypothetical protein [Fimbriimonadaceae bacterium]
MADHTDGPTNLQVFRTALATLGFKDLERVSNARRDALLTALQAFAPGSVPQGGSGVQRALWDGLGMDDECCASKTIQKLASAAGTVGIFIDLEWPLLQATPPDHPWAHLLGESDWDAVLDVHVFPMHDPSWLFIKTQEAAFGPYLLPWAVLQAEKESYVPTAGLIEALLQALDGALLPSDTVKVSADHERYRVRAVGPDSDLTIGVDRCDHRLYAFATRRAENESDTTWESGHRIAFSAITAGEVAEGTDLEDAFLPLVDPDDVVEVSTRLRLAVEVIYTLRRRLG